MKRYEQIVSSILLFGLLLVCLNIGIGYIIVIISTVFAIGFYFLFSFFYFNNIPVKDILRLKKYNLPFGNIVMSLLSGFAIVLGLVGMLFFVQIWHNYMGFWVIGIYATGIVFFINLLLVLINKGQVYKRIIVRISSIFAILILCGIFYYYLIPIIYSTD